jgi:hypothetical protein
MKLFLILFNDFFKTCWKNVQREGLKQKKHRKTLLQFEEHQLSMQNTDQQYQ